MADVCNEPRHLTALVGSNGLFVFVVLLHRLVKIDNEIITEFAIATFQYYFIH